MSEAILFEYPYNLFLMQRLEFVILTQDELEAKIMRIVEYEMVKQKEAWQNRVAQAIEAKKTPPKEPKVYWVRLSYAQVIGKLYKFDSAKVGAKHPLSLSKGTLRKAITSLIEKGFLFMRSKPGEEFGAPLYTLNRDLIQQAMRELPKDPFSVFFIGGGTNFEPGGEVQILNVPPTNFESGEVENLDLPLTEIEPPQVQNLEVFKDIDNNDSQEEKETKKEDSVVADATDTPNSPSLLSESDWLQEDLEETQPRIKAQSKYPPNEIESHLPIVPNGLQPTENDGHSQNSLGQEQAPHLQDIGAVTPLASTDVGTLLRNPLRDSPHDTQGVPSPLQGIVNNPGLNPNKQPPHPDKTDTNVTQASLIPQVPISTVEEWTLAHDQYVEKLRSEWKAASKDAKQWYGNKWDNYKNRFLGEWKKTHPKPIELQPMSPEAKIILDCWRSLFKRQSPITPSDIKGAEMLVESKPICEELAACRQWMFDTEDPNRPWYRKKGLGLLDVAKDFGKWQSTLDAARTKQEPPLAKAPTRTKTRAEWKDIPV
jgi:hypothetical protein